VLNRAFKCASSDSVLIKLCEQINTLGVIPGLTWNRIIRFFIVVDYAVPDQVGHDGRERACYTELLNVQVLALASSSCLNKHTLWPSFPRCNRGNRIMRFFKASKNAVPEHVWPAPSSPINGSIL
jgi:hypothetical protein